jgi:hypothetical protein
VLKAGLSRADAHVVLLLVVADRTPPSHPLLISPQPVDALTVVDVVDDVCMRALHLQIDPSCAHFFIREFRKLNFEIHKMKGAANIDANDPAKTLARSSSVSLTRMLMYSLY